jgi:hypothetical protein
MPPCPTALLVRHSAGASLRPVRVREELVEHEGVGDAVGIEELLHLIEWRRPAPPPRASSSLLRETAVGQAARQPGSQLMGATTVATYMDGDSSGWLWLTCCEDVSFLLRFALRPSISLR